MNLADGSSPQPHRPAAAVTAGVASTSAVGSSTSVPPAAGVGQSGGGGFYISVFPTASEGESKMHAAAGRPLEVCIAVVRRWIAKFLGWFQAKPPAERRALVFGAVFLLLVMTSVAQSADSSAGPVAQVGLLPQFGMHGASGILVADVNNYAIIAVADNDGRGDAVAASKRLTRPPDQHDDIDHSRDPAAALVTGKLALNPTTKRWSVEWNPETQWITSLFAVAGRGMELSTLQYWRDGKLYSCDDRTGIVYELNVQEGTTPTAVPRYVVADGNGNVGRGMRCEWSAVKGDFLMLGSTGKPRTDIKSNLVVNQDALWVKSISPLGEVRHLDWAEPYAKLRGALGIVRGEGYVMHECAAWSRVHKRWLFVPRHVSSSPYNPADERRHGSTVMLLTDAEFRHTRSVALPPMRSSSTPYGVTECKFIPNGKDDEVLIVKAITRDDGLFDSVVAIVGIDGRLIMDDAAMPPGFKFEGLELRPMVHTE